MQRVKEGKRPYFLKKGKDFYKKKKKKKKIKIIIIMHIYIYNEYLN